MIREPRDSLGNSLPVWRTRGRALIREPRGMRGHVPSAPPGRWLVALPAWGERCVGVLLAYTLPALAAALRQLGKPTTLLVWTDAPTRVAAACEALGAPGDLSAKFLPVPGPDGSFMSMSGCHREALALAGRGDRVLLLTSDMVLSREVLATCEQHLAGGKQLICCVAPRALQDAGPPVGATGRDLLAWAWENRHPMTRDCTWPDGRSYDVWRMYFERGGAVSARVFLPHPLVCVPDGRRLTFSPTIDVNLTSNFSQAFTYMITRPEEGAAVEISPTDKEYLKTTTMRERLEAGGPSCPALVPCSNHRHRMFWGKRVVLVGTGGDCGDAEVVARVLG